MTQDDRNNQNYNQAESPTVANMESDTLPNTEKGGNIYPTNDEPKSDDKGNPNDNSDSRSTKDADEGDSKSNIENDDDIDASDRWGLQLLMHAVCEGALDAVTFLVDHGADVNATYDEYSSSIPLIRAAYAGGVEFTKFITKYYDDLCDEGVYWNESYSSLYGYTPLSMAVAYKRFDVAKFLIERGANVNYTSVRGSPLMFAASIGDLDFVKFLVERGADVNAEITTCKGRYIGFGCRKFPILYSDGAKEEPVHGVTPLICVAYKGHLDVVEFLLEHGAKVNAKEDKYGYTPLISSVSQGKFDVAKVLLENGADTNVRKNDGEKPIDIARRLNRPDLVELLREYGAEE